jgi:hypothetical protein
MNGNETLTPSFRQHGRLNTDTVSAISESLMKKGVPSPMDQSVNQITVRWITERKHIGLNGNQQFLGGVWKLSEQSLAANDDKFRRASDGSGSPNDMLKLWSEHGGSGI